MNNEPNYILANRDDLDYLVNIFRGRKLPDLIKRNVIAWHNHVKKGAHLIMFGDCTNVQGGTCVKCEEDMFSYGGYAGDTRTDTEAYFKECRGYTREELVIMILEVIDRDEEPTDEESEYLVGLFNESGLKTENAQKFYDFYRKNRDLINKNEQGEITGFQNKPEEYK